jgi:hypothetical protein
MVNNSTNVIKQRVRVMMFNATVQQVFQFYREGKFCFFNLAKLSSIYNNKSTVHLLLFAFKCHVKKFFMVIYNQILSY